MKINDDFTAPFFPIENSSLISKEILPTNANGMTSISFLACAKKAPHSSIDTRQETQFVA